MLKFDSKRRLLTALLIIPPITILAGVIWFILGPLWAVPLWGRAAMLVALMMLGIPLMLLETVTVA
jgi:hypothetical protein